MPFNLYIEKPPRIIHYFESKYKISESKNRQRPILIISKLEDISRFIETYDMITYSFNSNWEIFINVKELINTGEHKTLSGLEEIMLLKGYLL